LGIELRRLLGRKIRDPERSEIFLEEILLGRRDPSDRRDPLGERIS
jgi:hypothetical protein